MTSRGPWRARRRRPSARRPPLSQNKKGPKWEYNSTMPKFNIASGSTQNERASLTRLRDLRKMGLLAKFTSEKFVPFQQRPQKDISLFLAGKSLKYCKLQSTSCQTGDDDGEVGTQTDDIWNDEKETQFPTLTMGSSAQSGGEQMLPFLRRVLPLFEASMGEARQAQGAGWQQDMADAVDQRHQARCGLPEGFVSRCLGTRPGIVDLAICPQWYGADHTLVLYTWPEVKRPAGGEGLDAFMRPVRSIAGLYPIERGVAGGGLNLRPARCLYSHCRLGSLAVVGGRTHLVVAGSEMGSLMVWDLRKKPKALDTAEGQGANVDPDVAHFEGPLWLSSAFSTDLFAFSSGRGGGGLDDGDGDDLLKGSAGADEGGGVHSVEICCVRCSDVVSGDVLIFALDLMGTVSFWRVLEFASGSEQQVKLALQGHLRLASSVGRCLGDFLSAAYLCVHPQQQAQFVVVSASGVRQEHRSRSSSVAIGPQRLELVRHRVAWGDEEDEELGSCAVQPCSAAFNPFFPGLLLAAYAEGDLALFDSLLCVPVAHWASAVGKAPSQSTTVAWSTRRPCVFFVKCGDTLDVWDLAEQSFGPVMTIDVPGGNGGMGAPSQYAEFEAATCADLYIDAHGRPVASSEGEVSVFGLPASLTTPMQTIPPRYSVAEKPIDSLLVPGYEKAQVFPTLARHDRAVDVPSHCATERDLLRRILAGLPPMQAAV